MDLLNDKNVGAITTAIIVMAKKLGMKVVAEGIEDPGQSKILLEQGCEFAQGFLYYKPMPIAELRKLGQRYFD
jgi:EAL domain-containing protein (putative c-di-GMP-specific phosphodiesterase class I)